MLFTYFLKRHFHFWFSNWAILHPSHIRQQISSPIVPMAIPSKSVRYEHLFRSKPTEKAKAITPAKTRTSSPTGRDFTTSVPKGLSSRTFESDLRSDIISSPGLAPRTMRGTFAAIVTFPCNFQRSFYIILIRVHSIEPFRVERTLLRLTGNKRLRGTPVITSVLVIDRAEFFSFH